jgi:hypothetical protein
VIPLATQPEVLAIEEAYRAAQARLGISGAYLALRSWEGVSVQAPVATADAWLTRSLQMINAIRRKSGRLARAYYQLARALETGYTLGYPEYSNDPKQITMGGLRKQYLDLLLEVADLDKPRSDERTTSVEVTTNADELWLQSELVNYQGEPVNRGGVGELNFADTELDDYIDDLLAATENGTDDDLVEVDEYDGWEDDALTPEELREIYEEDLLRAARERERLIARLEASEEATAKQAFAKAQQIHDNAGSVSAGIVDQAGIDAGRDVINTASSQDRRVMMWARITGHNPCAFCAMLASRGFAYTSKKRAGALEAYHPNCHCSIICRWDQASDTAPERTQHYVDLWKDQMKGKAVEQRGTKHDTLNKWRRIINAERRAYLESLRVRNK